jgi:hypothetical protein
VIAWTARRGGLSRTILQTAPRVKFYFLASFLWHSGPMERTPFADDARRNSCQFQKEACVFFEADADDWAKAAFRECLNATASF